MKIISYYFKTFYIYGRFKIAFFLQGICSSSKYDGIFSTWNCQGNHFLLWWTVCFCQFMQIIWIENLFDFSHNVGSDPIPIAQQIRQQYGATIVSVGVPGINGFLKPIDLNELYGISGNPSLVINVQDISQLPAFERPIELLLPCGFQTTSTTTTTPMPTTSPTCKFYIKIKILNFIKSGFARVTSCLHKTCATWIIDFDSFKICFRGAFNQINICTYIIHIYRLF